MSPVKIGVLSDTHLPAPDDELRRCVEDLFSDAAMIFHAGDLTQISVLDVFKEKPCIAVRGNMDRGEAKGLPGKQVVEVGGVRIGLIHGWGSPWGLENRILKEFKDVHVIVFGHTHKPTSISKNGVFLFNPGAYSGSLFLKKNRSVGILTVGETIGARHIRLST
jgi:putative phosphoesterase